MDTSTIIERAILEFHRSYECVANSIVSRDLKFLTDMPSAGIAMCVILLQIIIVSLYRSRQIIYQILDSIVAVVLLVSLLVIVFGLPIGTVPSPIIRQRYVLRPLLRLRNNLNMCYPLQFCSYWLP
jgi:hypothetical protein